MISIAEFSNDEATETVTYRSHEVEFTFRPGAYTGALALQSTRNAQIIAACVTSWNIELPITEADIETLPAGLTGLIYLRIVELSTQVDLPEA